jgi:hypothetical protein
MAGPLGVLAAGPAAATTEAGDVDGGPPRGCSQDFQQRPPPKLETSTVGPLGVLAVGLAVATTDIEDVDGGAPGGCWRQVWQRPPLKLDMSMAGPLGVAIGISGSGHQRC